MLDLVLLWQKWLPNMYLYAAYPVMFAVGAILVIGFIIVVCIAEAPVMLCRKLLKLPLTRVEGKD